MNLNELKAAIGHAERGSLTDLGKVLRAIAEGETLVVGGVEVTASAAELNKLDGAGAVVASGTQAAYSEVPANIAAALVAFGIMAPQ